MPLCKGWTEFKGEYFQHFDSDLMIVVMNEIPELHYDSLTQMMQDLGTNPLDCF